MREPHTKNLTQGAASLTIPDVESMRALGRALGAALLQPAEKALVLAIRGDLGAGKTTLVGGILNGVGVAGIARSPTYTLIEPYEASQRHIFHLDLYRLADPHEVEALGLRDLLTNDAALLIEWPERGEGVLPAADLTIAIDYASDDGRVVTLTAASIEGARLLAAARSATQLKVSGLSP